MFERYTEKARRVVFFARYEASQYGSPHIESEHLLLGLLRENEGVVRHLIPKLAPNDAIREEIERHITRGERISTSVEMPLSKECKQALTIAAEEARQLGHPYVGTEHLLLGLLAVGKGLAATILIQHQAKIEDVRARVKNIPAPASLRFQSAQPAQTVIYASSGSSDAAVILQSFLRGLRVGLKEQSTEFLSPKAQYLDACGMSWSGEENLHKKMAELFAPFAAKNAKYVIEETIHPRDGLCIATLLWEDVPFAEKTPKGLCRMVVALGRGEGEGSQWSIYSVQVTPVMRA
jgi:hypothetical protein